MTLPRIAVICDFREENWPSMDLVADMLCAHLQTDYAHLFAVTRICPPMRRRFTRQRSENTVQQSELSGQMPAVGGRQSRNSERLFNADRLLNRFWDYPRFIRSCQADFDLFQLIDHSYGQLLHELPPERTVVTCHDLDTFQCLLEPTQDPRSVLFRKMMQRTLSGFRRAARVTCDSVATRDQLLAYDLVPAVRTIVIPNGVHPSCSPEPNAVAEAAAARIIGAAQAGRLDILHVGSTIPRKRIEVLLQIFAKLPSLFPSARLLRVGGDFTAEQLALVEQLALGQRVLVLPRIDSDVLAAVYRRAALVLQPSEREGFGLPVVEAMACGTPVVASDIPALREVGGDAAQYCPVGDLEAWTETIATLLRERSSDDVAWQARRKAGLRQSRKFTWAEYAGKMAKVYREVLG